MAKKRDTLEVLAEHGLILKGTTIELLPTKRGDGETESRVRRRLKRIAFICRQAKSVETKNTSCGR